MNLLRHIKGAFLGAPIILLLTGLAFFGVGGGLTYYQFVFKMDALQAPGEVIGLSERCDDDGCTYYPQVNFSTQNGERVTYESSFGSSPPEYEVGEAVTVFYKSEDPANAIIAGEGGILRIIFMSVGGLVSLAGMLLFGVNLYKSYLANA